ncbi:RHS repeat-associated core domain protein [Acinetobacter sp. 1000160]|nr:RHS repeat-associated core domain protein [Acinetobacter baumannii 146457]EYT22518.1 RHS repeat-associated core domain protein [Acinetobacter sp. 1000160]
MSKDRALLCRKRKDQETGLHYNRYRYYSPYVGRFISKDPIGLLGGNNVYAYAPNPVSWIDPLGLAKKKKQNNVSETNNCKDDCGGILLLDPKDINFAQRSVNPKFDTPDGKISIQSSINNGAAQVANFPPISVINVKGQWVARDGNSRLLIAKSTKATSISAIDDSGCLDKRKDLNSRLRNNGLPSQGTSNLPKY